MGWWWWSASKEPPSSPDQQFEPQPNSRPSKPPSATPQNAAPKEKQKLSRDDQALADLARALEEDEQENGDYNPNPAAATSQGATTRPARQRRPPRRGKQEEPEPSPEDQDLSLYPSTMSCNAAFDLAYRCQSGFGQLKHYYRYGETRRCNDQWAQFRFCMRTKVMGEKKRRQKIQEWNLRKAVKFKTERSSEDVWDVRWKPLDRLIGHELPEREGGEKKGNARRSEDL
ncbi:MAG: hypothetical protein M1831_003143 [Alyxoria varia]|nr:MAG: hypothetical protein M1831_003143 [Alyxoria varia]